MAYNNNANASRGIPGNQQQQQQVPQPRGSGAGRPRNRDIARMAQYNKQAFDSQNQGGNWSGQVRLEERTAEAYSRARGPPRTQSRRSQQQQTGRRPPPAATPSTTETPPKEELAYSGNGRGSKPVKKTLGHNYDCAGFIPLVRQVYDRMCCEDSRLTRTLPFPIFQHAMVEFLVAYQLHHAKFVLKVPQLQNLMDPLAAISASQYNIPIPIYEYICSFGPTITTSGDKVFWNLPDCAIPRPVTTAHSRTVRSGSFGPVTAENHNVYECYISPYVTSKYIQLSAANTRNTAEWNPFPTGWYPADCVPTENLLGYKPLVRHHQEAVNKMNECNFEDSDSITGLLCHSAYAMDQSSATIGSLTKVKCVKAEFVSKENSAAFIIKSHNQSNDPTTVLWDEPATLFSPFAFATAASNKANYMSFKRHRPETAPGTCYVCSGATPEGWAPTRNANFASAAPFSLQRGFRFRESLQAFDHEEEEGLGTTTQELFGWLDTILITK